MTVNKSLSNPKPPLASLKSKSKLSEQRLLHNGSFLQKSDSKVDSHKNPLVLGDNFILNSLFP